MKLFVTFVVLVLASPVYSQSATEKGACKAIGPAMSDAGSAFSKMYSAMKSMNYDPLIAKFTGDRKLAIIALKEKQAATLAPFEEYLIALEDSAIQMRRCAR